MKSRFLIAIILLVTSFSGKAQSTDNVKVLKQFYISYVAEFDNEKKLEALRKKYCTPKLLYKLKHQELDYDPFLNGQDTDDNFSKTLVITKDVKKPDVYIVSYTDSGTGKKITIKLQMVGDKIDSIL